MSVTASDTTPIPDDDEARPILSARAIRDALAIIRQRQDDTAGLLGVLADIRHACGDDGKRMWPELVEHIRSQHPDHIDAVGKMVEPGQDEREAFEFPPRILELLREAAKPHAQWQDSEGGYLHHDALKAIKWIAARLSAPQAQQWMPIQSATHGDYWFALNCGHVAMGAKVSDGLIDWECDEDCCHDAAAVACLPILKPAPPTTAGEGNG
jgi:hypothetical protein